MKEIAVTFMMVILGGDGEGGNGKGGDGAGGDEEGGSSNPITENHQEPFVMIEDTGCNYSGWLSNQPLSRVK